MVKPSLLRPLATYSAIGLPLALLVFLWTSSFFVAWSGTAASWVPLGEGEPSWYRVLIVTPSGEEVRSDWPAEEVGDLALPIDRYAIAPMPIPDDLPTTRKRRFTLSFTVAPPDGAPRTVPTTSPSAAALAALAFLLGLALRNMYVSGLPWGFFPEDRHRVLPQDAAGRPVPAKGGGGGGAPAPGKRPPPRKGGRKRKRKR